MKHKNRKSGHSMVVLAVALAIGMVVAIYLGQTIGYGEWKKTYLAVLVLCAFPVMLMLGNRYWLVLPFAMTVSIPAIPLVAGRSMTLGELWTVAALGTMLLRLPLSQVRLRIFRREYIPLLLYVAWAVMIFFANNVGFAIMGASTVGGRSFLSIGLGLCAFIVLANQNIEDRDCKWIIFSLLAAGVVSAAWRAYKILFLDPGVESFSGAGFYSWHQALSSIPMFFLAFIFAWRSLPELLARLNVGLLTAVGGLYALAAFSGKRAAFAACVGYPLIASLVRRQFLLAAAVFIAASLTLGVLVAGHGRVFELPETVQRTLSPLPGKWDQEVRRNTTGSFRRTLNWLALEQIHRNPILGKGFGITSLDMLLTTDPGYLQRLRREGDHVQAYAMGAAGQWHNTWLGISAAFGIPAAVIWALVWFQLLRTSYRISREAEEESYAKVLALMIFLIVSVAVLRSWTSGHAADTMWTASWQLGVILAMKFSLAPREATEREALQGKVTSPGLETPVPARHQA